MVKIAVGVSLLAIVAISTGFTTASCGRVSGPSTIGAPSSAGGSIPPATSAGIWVSSRELAGLAEAGPAWVNLESEAERRCGVPNLADQEDRTDICLLSKALVYARTGAASQRDEVVSALEGLASSGPYRGRSLALGRNLPAVVVAADLVDLSRNAPDLDARFRAYIRELLTTPTAGGPDSLVECHERRPNNWGTHCGAGRAAIAAYLRDTTELARVAQVFRGFLGDRNSYAGFEYGELDWQCDPARPVGINRSGCTKDGHSIDGVLPDDQRRGGGFSWPPPRENYVYEALQGAIVQAVILDRAGYKAFDWENRALLRAFEWLDTQASYQAIGDDVWQIHLVNHYYGTHLPAVIPAQPGKNMAWTDWTHWP